MSQLTKKVFSKFYLSTKLFGNIVHVYIDTGKNIWNAKPNIDIFHHSFWSFFSWINYVYRMINSCIFFTILHMKEIILLCLMNTFFKTVNFEKKMKKKMTVIHWPINWYKRLSIHWFEFMQAIAIPNMYIYIHKVWFRLFLTEIDCNT